MFVWILRGSTPGEALSVNTRWQQSERANGSSSEYEGVMSLIMGAHRSPGAGTRGSLSQKASLRSGTRRLNTMQGRKKGGMSGRVIRSYPKKKENTGGGLLASVGA